MGLIFIKKLFAPKEIDHVYSKYNGQITIIDDHGKKRILVGGLTQSGPLIESIWNKPIKHIKKEGFTPDSCLILGLGGGTVAGLVARTWPSALITGIEIDPDMVKLGKKYLHLNEVKRLTTIIGDARDKVTRSKQKYDLILVDVYKGGNIPIHLKTPQYFRRLFERLNPGGVIVFNLLFYTTITKQEAEVSISIIEKFSDITLLRELTNLLVVCKSKTGRSPDRGLLMGTF